MATNNKRIAIQGEEGSYSAEAARQLFCTTNSLLYCDSLQDVFSALDLKEVDCAVLPVENTTAGNIQEVWDRLIGIIPGPPLAAHAEVRIRITFVTAVLPESNTVRQILAHPVAEAQCKNFLRKTGWQIIPCHDTAGAARMVREQQNPNLAALCPPLAAETYALKVIAQNCGDSSRTWTRFFLLEPGDIKPEPTHNRTVLTFTLHDAPGALAQSLQVFAQRGLNLCSIHSRAIPGNPGDYKFLTEVEAGAANPKCIEAIEHLRNLGAQVRIIGSLNAPEWPED